MLKGPQSLEMLADAVADSGWPSTRKETLALACRRLLFENNPEHPLACGRVDGSPRLLHMAGQLCALQLLAGKAGYTGLHVSPEGHEYLDLAQVGGKHEKTLRRVLGTKLFVAPSAGCFAPVHRQVAEFLGGRYLAACIQDEGLPLGRVLALMTGRDARVVSELRGLAAWLAAHSISSRREIIRRDPLGVVLYGDAREFSVSEKRLILESLEREARQNREFLNRSLMDSRLGDIATPDMEEEIKSILLSPSRNAAQQSLVWIVLFALTQAPPVRSILDLMLDMVRDGTRDQAIRQTALDEYVRGWRGDECAVAKLKAILYEIRAEEVSDPEQMLQWRLLETLYPSVLSPPELVSCLPVSATPLSTSLQFFFHTIVPRRSDAVKAAELMDALVEGFDRLVEAYSAGSASNIYLLSKMIMNSLLRALDKAGNQPDPERLYRWLSIASDVRLDQRSAGEGKVKQIRDWLGARPDMQKLLIEVGVARSAHEPDAPGISRRLFEANQPADKSRRRSVRTAQQERKRRERRNRVKEQERSLRENCASPQLLHFLAKGYLGGFGDISGATPRERLADLLDGDEALLRLVLKSFRRTVVRGDLPDVETVLALAAENKLHFLTLPFAAGLHELEQSKPDGNVGLNEDRMRLAIAIQFLAPLWPLHTGSEAPPVDQEPQWFMFSLQSHPHIVAEVLIQIARGKLRKRSPSISGLHQLARDSRYRDVARFAALPILKSFPVRCNESRLTDLRDLLYAACLHSSQDALANLIEGKLASRSMNVGQRVFWLAAGLAVRPDEYIGPLASYIDGNERRILYLARLLAGWFDMPAAITERLDVGAAEMLIRHVGSICKPYPDASDSRVTEGGFVTPIMEAGLSVGAFIHRLASDPSAAAESALKALSSDHGLRAWRTDLQNALQRQGVVRREADFRHASPEDILRTIHNAAPANAADLCALTADHLVEIGKKIRHGNTSDWRQYWNSFPGDGALVPVHENMSRDALLSDLSTKLEALGIDVHPEGRHANEKRSDIRVAYGGELCVPIEVKKSCSPDLWSAIRDQLIARYARDPGADGYGIYLVFWFGVTENCRPTSGKGPPPKSAGELHRQLLDTLSDEESRKISVCVIDVARPC